MRWSKTFTVVDCHAEGEIGKVVTGGVFDVPGATMFDKMRYLEQHRDGLRKFLLFEPRGAVNHNANIILPTSNPDAAMGFVILESTEYPAMSGSNTICVAFAVQGGRSLRPRSSSASAARAAAGSEGAAASNRSGGMTAPTPRTRGSAGPGACGGPVNASVSAPGRYRLTLPAFEGYQPVAPLEIDIPPATFVERAIVLIRED